MTDAQNTPFVRDLASSDRKTRDKALDSLTLFLRSKTNLSLIDLLKLWKGLFFCFYHSDRPLTQQALARSLSYTLVPSLPRATLHRFLRAFWITIGREFHAIDRLRLDKYMFLIRCYVGVAFEIFVKEKQSSPQVQTRQQQQQDGKKRKRVQDAQKQNKRSKGKKQQTDDDENEEHDASSKPRDSSADPKWTDLEAYLTILEQGPLYPLNFDPDQPSTIDEATDYVPMPHGPDGLRYHIMDVWLDELEKVIEFEDQGENGNGDADKGVGVDVDEGEEEYRPRKVVSDVPMDLLRRPIETLRVKGLHKPVRTRAAEALADERLVEWGFREKKVDKSEEAEESDEEWGGFGDD